jgi:hypothetical protein
MAHNGDYVRYQSSAKRVLDGCGCMDAPKEMEQVSNQPGLTVLWRIQRISVIGGVRYSLNLDHIDARQSDS